jgi:hypothetical protein
MWVLLPSHKIHCFVDRKLFGKSYWRLHRQIDMPYLFLGREHRVLFHDPVTAVAIARKLYPGDPRAEEAALVHIQLDMHCSSNRFFAQWLEIWAEKDARERKSARKKKAKPKKRRVSSDPVEEFRVFLEKMQEIRLWARIALGDFF